MKIRRSSLSFRDLVVQRRLAPFYTPLQDYDDTWTDDELVALVRQNPLHALDSAYGDEEEQDDVDDHKIHRSQNYYRRQEQKQRLLEMLARVKDEQRQCENEYLEARTTGGNTDPQLASRDLILKLYRGASECPICFLYFPRLSTIVGAAASPSAPSVLSRSSVLNHTRHTTKPI